jgi:hypothetical protein
MPVFEAPHKKQEAAKKRIERQPGFLKDPIALPGRLV